MANGTSSMGGGLFGLSDLVSNLKNAVVNISHLNSSIQSTLVTLGGISTSMASGVLDLAAINTSLAAVGGIGTSIASGVIDLAAISTSLAAINTSIVASFPRISGTFTLSAATVSVVTQTLVGATWKVAFTPTNGTAALTLFTKGLYVSAVTAGSGFSVSTYTTTAVGTETFEYIGFNPS